MAYAQKRTPPSHLLAFKMHSYKQASTAEKLGRLLVVLVDGPESLPLHQAARRLGFHFSIAKAQLKKYRKIFDAEKNSQRIQQQDSLLAISEHFAKSDASDCQKSKRIKQSPSYENNAHLSQENTTLTVQSIDSPEKDPSPPDHKHMEAPVTKFSQEKSHISDPSDLEYSYLQPSCQEQVSGALSHPRSSSQDVSRIGKILIQREPQSVHAPRPVRNLNPPSGECLAAQTLQEQAQALREICNIPALQPQIASLYSLEQSLIQSQIEDISGIIQGYLSQTAQQLHAELQRCGQHQ